MIASYFDNIFPNITFFLKNYRRIKNPQSRISALRIKVQNKSSCKKLTGAIGGEGGIRTLDALLTHTRVPVVRHKPG